MTMARTMTLPAVILLACLCAPSLAQDATDAIFDITFHATSLNPGDDEYSNTDWEIVGELRNFRALFGLKIALYEEEFGGVPMEIMSISDPIEAFSFVPGRSNAMLNNIFAAGTLQDIFPPSGPMLLWENCADIPSGCITTDDDALPSCYDIHPQKFVVIWAKSSKPLTPEEVVIGGDPVTGVDYPMFETYSVGSHSGHGSSVEFECDVGAMSNDIQCDLNGDSELTIQDLFIAVGQLSVDSPSSSTNITCDADGDTILAITDVMLVVKSLLEEDP